MDADERDICIYLKSWSKQFVGMREISRRAGGKRRFRNDPEWAVPVVNRLVERSILESDSGGHYRIKSPAAKKEHPVRWVSPHVREILERSGKSFDGIIEIEDIDNWLEELEAYADKA